MIDLIDNQNKLLGDDMKVELKKDSKVKIAASYFSIYAYNALKTELENIKELEFVFTSPTFVGDKVSDKIKKEQREFYIPKQLRENSLYGTDFEIKLRNQMTQKAIAKECAEWIRRKVKFKSVKTSATMPNFISVESTDEAVTYSPVRGFTAVDLGYQKGDNLFTCIQKTDLPAQSNYYISQFEQVWKDNIVLDDVTNSIVDYIASCYNENSPEYIYFVILYNIFKEFLQDLYEDYLPNEATGFKDSLVWNKLYNFQKDGAVGVINKLEKYNGCILADSVGLGKTFTALAVMDYYSLRNKSILVLCPKRLAANWNAYRGNTKTNIFYEDRIRYDVLYHTDLGRRRGLSNGLDLATINWGNYDLVVIDESHNFRNANVTVGKDTRYDFLMEQIMKQGVKTKVLMLSATPVNNRYNDLKNQLALAYCGNFDALDSELDTDKTVVSIFRNAQKAFNAWSKQPVEKRHAQDLLDKLDIDFSVLLDSVTIARSRKHIQKYYDTKEIGSFPQRMKAKSYHCKLTSRTDVIPYKTIYEKLIAMTMSVYAPLAKVFPSRIPKYEEKYDLDLGDIKNIAERNYSKQIDTQRNRENGVKKLMSINLLKRLESSVYSFALTLNNIIATNQTALDIINKYIAGDKDAVIDKEVFDYAQYNPDEDEEEFELTKVSSGKKIKVALCDIDIISWKQEIESDIATLYYLRSEALKITPEYDSKLAELKSLIDDKINCPINAGNKKFLIFSAFADTTDYLYNNISDYVLNKYGLYTAKIEGGNKNNKSNDGGNNDTDRILAYFAPLAKNKDLIYKNDDRHIDVLIGTDCISEGQNLQDADICINYDIHWNPVRIVQRFGRIDRIGSQNKYIQLVNFWPDISLDEYINLNKRVSARMTIVNATATADDNILSDESEELDYRAVQLKKLQEGELQDLEDVDGSITITDLGLNEFRMDMVAYLKEHGEPKAIANGLHAVVKADASKGIERGVIYVLRNRNNSVNVDKQNRLHPYYLVYLNDDGEVIYNHLQVKNILDIIRTTCKFGNAPIADLCRQFNKETKDGYKMEKYSELLDDAIKTIVDVKEEKELESLFKSGSKVLFQQSAKGLEDFELISFIVIK